MLKINFNIPLPKNKRDSFIKCMKELGFSFEREFQDSEYQKFHFYGDLPEIISDEKIDVVICADGKNKKELLELLLKNVRVEIIILFEREEKENEDSDVGRCSGT